MEKIEKIPCVGFFDSGIGGLTVLHACRKVFQNARYLYFGDNANAPYGEKSKEEILHLTTVGATRLLEEGANVIVLACNTATAAAVEELRARLPVPVIGVEPAIAPAAKACRNVLVLCTPYTAQSGRLRAQIERYPNVEFIVCPLTNLALSIERYANCHEAIDLEKHLKKGEFDGVVLGCTHYVFLKDEIQNYYGASTYDSGEGVAKRLLFLLEGQKEEGVLKVIGTADHRVYKNNTNIRSGNECDFFTKNGVFFIGEQKMNNKNIYERMFAF